MKGKALNQLHNYLEPMIGIFGGLESSDYNLIRPILKQALSRLC